MIYSSRTKLIALLSIILVTAFTSVSILNVHTARNAMIEEVSHSSLPLLRQNILSEIQKDILPALNTASVMANDYFLIQWTQEGEHDEAEVIAFLKKIQGEYGFFSTFFVSDFTKKYYHYSGVNKIVSKEDEHDIWYYDFISSGKAYALDVDTDEAGGDLLTMFLNFRVEDKEGNLVGVTGIGIKMESFSKFLQEKQDKYNRTIFLTDADGLIQAHSDLSQIEQSTIFEETGSAVVAKRILSNKNSPLDLKYKNRGEDILISTRYIKELDWFLIVELKDMRILGGSKKIIERSALIGFLSSLLIIFIVSMMVNTYNKKLENLSTIDPLTKIPNRREFNRLLERAFYRNERYGVPISALIIDLDNFKKINDTEGHQAGDMVLIEISSFILSMKRIDDVLARWGGDEFILLIESNLEDSINFAERLQKENTKRNSSVTFSIGVAQIEINETAESLIARADKALYNSKHRGKNRTSAG